MQGACPSCSTPLSLPQSGEYQCERCRRPFEVILSPTGGAALPPIAAPFPQSPYSPSHGLAYPAALPNLHTLVVAEQVASSEDPHCALHPQNRAATTCERCGDFICGVCSTPAEGRTYCPRCFDLLAERGGFAWSKNDFVAPQTALALAWASIPTMFMACAGLIPAIIAIITALDVLKQIAERPELPGRKKAIAALSIASATIVLSIAGAGLLIWAIVRDKN